MATHDQPQLPPSSGLRRAVRSRWALWTVIVLVIAKAIGVALEYAQNGTISELSWAIVWIWVAWVAVFFFFRRAFA